MLENDKGDMTVDNTINSDSPVSLQFLYNCKARGQFPNCLMIEMSVTNVIYVTYAKLFTTNIKAPTPFYCYKKCVRFPDGC